MTHGDDAGLMLPPRVAPIQVDCDAFWYFHKYYIAFIEIYFKWLNS